MKKIYLVDGNSFIYRMFYALPEFATKSWVIVNALFWMAKFFVWQLSKENPDYLVFIKDAKGDNFRHQIYADYKATRDKMPDNLKSQIALIEEMIAKMWIEIIEISGFEADDVIWTLATKLWDNIENEVFILTWDKDLFSLTRQNVFIYDTQKQKIYDDVKAREKFEVDALKIIDYLAIVWDSSDNIPGIAGFWPKKAVDLLNKYESIEDVFAHIEDSDFPLTWKTLEKLKEGREMWILSKKLATINKNVEIPWFDIDNFEFDKTSILNSDIIEFFKTYEFNSLIPTELQDKQKTIQDLDLKIEIVADDSFLENLKTLLKNESQIILDVKTTTNSSKDICGVWIKIWEKSYYIDYNTQKISKSQLQDFFRFLNNLDILIIWIDLKPQLEIIELFLDNTETKVEIKQIWFGF